MLVAVADTHAVIWYLNADRRLSPAAKRFMDNVANSNDQIGVSAITLVEMVYLIEKGRISAQEFTRLAHELDDPKSMFQEIPVDLDISRALTQVSVVQVPDMPDRIIAATSVRHKIPVISRDGKITLSSVKTIW